MGVSEGLESKRRTDLHCGQCVPKRRHEEFLLEPGRVAGGVDERGEIGDVARVWLGLEVADGGIQRTICRADEETR